MLKSINKHFKYLEQKYNNQILNQYVAFAFIYTYQSSENITADKSKLVQQGHLEHVWYDDLVFIKLNAAARRTTRMEQNYPSNANARVFPGRIKAAV